MRRPKSFYECPYCKNLIPQFEGIPINKCGHCGKDIPEVVMTFLDKDLARE